MSATNRKISRDETAQQDDAPLLVHVAVMNNDLKQLQQLIQSGAPQLHQKTYETALHVAARTPALECLKWLLDNYINSPRDRDCNGSTPCHYSVVYGNLEALKMLLNHDPKSKKDLSEMKGENGLSILGLAALQGDLTMVQWIVDNFPGLAYLKDKGGNVPIHLAAAGGAVDIVKFLVERYGREYAQQTGSEKKFQPLYYAVDKGKMNVVKYLVDEVKVDPLVKAKGGMTALHAAVTAHQVPIAKWLIEKVGPQKILEKSDDGATMLHLAAAEGLADLLEFLIQRLHDKTNVNIGDDIGSTPAHDAAEFGEHDVLLVLLKHGADISIKNQNGETPFDLAVENNHNDLIGMLADYREQGLNGLSKYTMQMKSDSSSGLRTNLTDLRESSPITPVRTSRQEAQEITNVIQQTIGIVEKRKEEEISRKISLQRLTDDDDLDSGDELEKELMKDRESHVSRTKPLREKKDNFEAIPHEMTPEGYLYAKVKKRAQRKISSSSDKEDGMSDIGSHASSHRVTKLGSSSVNHHKRNISGDFLTENDSASSIGTSASHSKRNEFPNGYPPGPYGYYPPYGPFPPHFGYHGKKRPRSAASGSSVGSGVNGMPHSHPMMPPGYPMGHQYPYLPAMVAQYYGYPYPASQVYSHPQSKRIDERIHMEALQKRGGQLFVPPPPGSYAGPFPPHRYGYFGANRRSRPSSGRSSSHSVPINTKTKMKHRDRAIGFGPAGATDDIPHESIDVDHPAPPPITKGGKIMVNPTELTHANFIMMKADEKGNVPALASEGTRLQRAKLLKYDGRYDDFIETDSEEEPNLPDHVNVGVLAESALVLIMLPILGIQGLAKLRPEEEKLSPQVYDEMEAQKTSKHWSTQKDLASKFNKSSSTKQAKATDVDDWSEMLGVSLTTPTKTKDIGGSIRARNFAIQEIKPSSLHQSMASLCKDDDDNDDDLISVVIGDDKPPLVLEELPVKPVKSSEKQEKQSKKKKNNKGSHQNKEKASSKRERKDAEKQSPKKSSKEQKSDKKKSSKMIVRSTSKKEEPIKEMRLKKTEISDILNSRKHLDDTTVTSVSVQATSSTNTGPVEVRNTAIINASDSEEEDKKNADTSSVDVEDIFAETEKEIEQMLAEMPRSPTNQSGFYAEGSEGRDASGHYAEMKITFPDREDDDMTDQEHQQLSQLQKMFPQSTDSQGEGSNRNLDLSSIIESLKMKPEDVTPQQQMKIQLIRNILAGQDPELIAKLLTLVSHGWSPVNDHESGSTTQLISDIENKLLESQEKQRLETEEHFRTQAQFSETLQRRLEEQAAKHMESIQQQLDLQKKMMSEKLEEQRKLLEEERKKHRHVKHHLTTSDSDSDDELNIIHATPLPVVVAKDKAKTMLAKIHHQSPLKWEDFSEKYTGIPEPPPPPPVAYLKSAINDPSVKKFGKRRGTSYEYEKTSRALDRDTSGELADDDDDEGLMLARAKIATRKRADIMKVEGDTEARTIAGTAKISVVS